jgi:hypothetical protein
MEAKLGFAPVAGAPYGRYLATKASTSAQRLLALDDLWTAELEQASGRGTLDEADVAMLRELVGEIQHGLRGLADQAYDLRTMLSEVSDQEVDSAFEAVVGSPQAAPDLRELAEPMLVDGGLCGATVAACEYVYEKADSEAGVLSEKLETIAAAGEVPAGDWKPPFRCAVALVMAGGAVTATILIGGGTPVLVGILVVDRVRSGIKEWQQEGCPAKLPHIGFGGRSAPAT